jgi:hypothetical protein
MARDYSTGFRLENEPAESGEDPVVSKKFRITIDVVATLASGPQGGVQPRSPEDVSHTKELTERLLARPGTLDRLLRRRAVEATWQAGRRILEAEYGLGGATEDELLEPIFAEL